jgi:hypothetical protein
MTASHKSMKTKVMWYGVSHQVTSLWSPSNCHYWSVGQDKYKPPYLYQELLRSVFAGLNAGESNPCSSLFPFLGGRLALLKNNDLRPTRVLEGLAQCLVIADEQSNGRWHGEPPDSRLYHR